MLPPATAPSHDGSNKIEVNLPPREEIGSKLSKKFGQRKRRVQNSVTPPPSPEKSVTSAGKSVRFSDSLSSVIHFESFSGSSSDDDESSERETAATDISEDAKLCATSSNEKELVKADRDLTESASVQPQELVEPKDLQSPIEETKEAFKPGWYYNIRGVYNQKIICSKL